MSQVTIKDNDGATSLHVGMGNVSSTIVPSASAIYDVPSVPDDHGETGSITVFPIAETGPVSVDLTNDDPTVALKARLVINGSPVIPIAPLATVTVSIPVNTKLRISLAA